MLATACLAITASGLIAVSPGPELTELRTGTPALDGPVTAYLEALVSDERAQMRDVIDRSFARATLARRSLDAITDAHMAIARQIDGIDAWRLGSVDVDRIEVLVELSGADAWVSFRFHRALEPGRLRGVSVVNAAPPERWLPDYGAAASLEALTDQLRVDIGSPALAIGLARADGRIESAVSGVRRADRADAVDPGDRFHLGSCTKTATAMLVQTLVDQGLVSWDTTLGAVFGDSFEMHARYRDETLASVARHRAGVVGHSDDMADVIARYAGLPGTPVEQRASYLADVLSAVPAAPSGRTSYSNAGFTILAHVCEHILGIPYEDALTARVLVPAGISSARFGWAASAAHPDGVWGHGAADASGELLAFDDPEITLGACLAAAGDLGTDIGDFARLAAIHLDGAPGPFDASSLRQLHAPAAGSSDGAGVGRGSLLQRPYLGHVGTTGIYWSRFLAFPEDGLAIVVATNAPVDATDEHLIESAIKVLIERSASDTAVPGTP